LKNKLLQIYYLNLKLNKMERISQSQFYATGTTMQMCWCAVALCVCWCAAASDIYECPAKHSPDFKFSVTSRRNKTGHWIAQVRRNYKKQART